MKRNVPLLGLVLVLIVGFPRPAKAGLWDWVQEWSGPGPFHGSWYNSMWALCPGKITGADNSEKRVLNTPYRPDRDNTCIFFDYRNFKNEDDDNFPASVSAKFYEVGVSARVHRAVEIGFGLGAVHLSSESGGNAVTETKMVLTVPRVAIKPILFFGPPSFWESHHTQRKIASILKFYFKENIIVGEMTAADFAVDPTVNSFRAKNDHVASLGFNFDVTELLR